MEYNFDNERQKLASTFEVAVLEGAHQYFDTHEFVDIIDFFLENNDTIKAEKAIKNALEQHPYSSSIQIKKADWLYETDRLDQALEVIDFVLEVDINNSDANELKGDILLKQDNVEDGISYLQKAIYHSEEKNELINKIGLEFLHLEHFDTALQFFLYILDEDLFDESAFYNSIYCYDVIGQNDELIKFLQKYLNKNPNGQIAWHQLGVQYKEKKDYKKALKAFDYAILIDESFLGAQFEKALCYEGLGEYHEAIKIYKSSIKADDPTAWAYYRIGVSYSKIEDTEQALVNFFNAIHEDPMFAKAWYKIASIYSDKSLNEKSKHYAERAVELEPENLAFNTLLARIYVKLSMFVEADNAYEELVILEVENPEIWIEYAIFLISIKMEQPALDILLASIKHFPENADILYRLSALLFSVKRDNEAVDFLREALRIDYTKKEVLKFINPDIYSTKVVQNMIFNQKYYGGDYIA